MKKMKSSEAIPIFPSSDRKKREESA